MWFYAYLLGLGEFGDMDDDWADDFAPQLAKVFFFISSMVVLIVMLNILIALVSEAYTRVMEKKEQANDFERVNMIADFSTSIKNGRKLFSSERYLSEEQSEYLVKARDTHFGEDEEDLAEQDQESMKRTAQKMDSVIQMNQSFSESINAIDKAIKESQQKKNQQ